MARASSRRKRDPGQHAPSRQLWIPACAGRRISLRTGQFRPLARGLDKAVGDHHLTVTMDSPPSLFPQRNRTSPASPPLRGFFMSGRSVAPLTADAETSFRSACRAFSVVPRHAEFRQCTEHFRPLIELRLERMSSSCLGRKTEQPMLDLHSIDSRTSGCKTRGGVDSVRTACASSMSLSRPDVGHVGRVISSSASRPAQS